MKHRKVKKIISAVFTALLICATLICLASVAGSLLKDDPSVFGFRAFYVLSGSMEPEIHESALVLVKRSSEYRVGDIITFTAKTAEIAGAPNTHRIIEVLQNGGKTEYITQGDANPVPDDDHVQQKDIIGKVIFHTGAVEWLGSFVEFIMTSKGFMLVVVLPIVLIVASCLKDYIKAYKEALEKVREEYEATLAKQAEKAEENADNQKIGVTTENAETAFTKTPYTDKNHENSQIQGKITKDAEKDGKETYHEGH